jgi:hypothetical protein
LRSAACTAATIAVDVSPMPVARFIKRGTRIDTTLRVT